MRLTTKGRYGLKAMIELARNNSGEHTSIKSIAESEGISENYLEQIFAVLKKAGLVQSMRGAQGGYVLGDDPDKITVGAVLRALEGSLAPVECVMENEPTPCEKADECVTKIVWEKIRDRINDVVDSLTLQELLDECSNKAENSSIQ